MSGRTILVLALATASIGVLGFVGIKSNLFRDHSTPLVEGITVGSPHFSSGDTAKGGHGQPIDGIPADSMEQLAQHIHAHLSIFYRGKEIAIPHGIGIIPPFQVESGMLDGRAYYWLHTHDSSGIIHVESPIPIKATLGEFFDIWGEPLETHDVAGFHGTVRIYVNRQLYSGNMRTLFLTAHENITLEVGSPLVLPPIYTFPKGL